MDIQAVKELPAWMSHHEVQPVSPEGEQGEALDTSLDMLQVLAACGEHVILLLDSDQAILHAAGPTPGLFGCPNLALRGKTLEQIARRYDGRRTGTASTRVLSAQRSDGALVLLEARFRRVLFAPPARTVCILRDVTAQVRMEEQIDRLQMLQPIGQLAAGIAHDFNNLLQTMMGSLELLLGEIGDRPGARENVENALRMSERGARLTHHLLAFVHQGVARPTALALPPLVDEIAHTLRRTLGPRIKVVTEVATDLPSVRADAGQTEAALLNLALNARDAMPDGGTVRIAISTCTDATDLAGPPAALVEWVVLTVSDTGTGMNSDVLARACEPFFSTKGRDGTGLGLSMVQAFARQSGGDLRLSSTPGAGTSSEIRLPIAHEQPPSKPAVDGSVRHSGRVLLVDDEPEVLVTFGSFLRGAGFAVQTARGGEEAIIALSSDAVFDVMVTDYAMPDLGSDELIGHVREIAPDLPILVVSGYGEAERLIDVTHGLRVLRKPFRRAALVQEVAALTGQRSRD